MNLTRMIGATLLGAALAGVTIVTAGAQSYDRHDRRDDRRPRAHDERRWQGDIRHFRDHDFARWRTGHWYHGRYGGRLGWWWLVGGAYYWYPSPIYPYPDPYTPPVVVTQPAPAPQPMWYYCDSARAYYPYVAECPGGWRAVPATPAPPVPR